MSDLIFKNLTSHDHKRRTVSRREVVDKEGVKTIIRRRLIYKIIEVNADNLAKQPDAQVYIQRKRNNSQQKESYFCRMKSNIYAKSNGKTFLIMFGHSFKVDLRPSNSPFLP
ncbi:MAG: hypothetical protein KKH80_02055 [Candidatus Omnitrophica bacterium]|nr:hypothetical protein [Candidatus Omnitrophota bacterium]